MYYENTYSLNVESSADIYIYDRTNFKSLLQKNKKFMNWKLKIPKAFIHKKSETEQWFLKREKILI